MYSFYKQKLLGFPCPPVKFFWLMRLTIIICLIAFFQVSANTYAQRISLAEKNAKLAKVFDKISAQSNYDFFISETLLNKAVPVTVNFKNLELKDALTLIFENQPLEFKIADKSVLVTEKPRSLLDKIIAVFKKINVRGKVTNEAGEPLPGAVVNIKGTKRSVAANEKGEFAFPDVAEGAVLVFTYIGYERQEIIASSGIMRVYMIQIAGNLDEVSISTGYQKIKKDQLTGAVATVSEAQYHQREAITGNFLESLEGKVPGLVYNGQTGELSIRGVATFDAVKTPLIVLDGFPTEIDIRTINPNDIVSISVLKDAAAASIYGVRASNGVIVIETKRGKAGKAVFNLNSSLAMQPKPDFAYLKYMGAAELVQLQRNLFYFGNPSSEDYDQGYFKMNPTQEILFKGPRPGVTNPALSQQQVDEQLLALGAYDNLNDYGQLFYQNRLARNINFDVSGGSESNTYMLGFNYIGERPVNKGSENNQYNLNLANTFKFSKHISFDFKGTYSNSTNQRSVTPGYGDFFPYEHLTDASGNALPVALPPGMNSYRAVTPATNKILMAAGLYDMLYYPYGELAANSSSIKTSALRLQGRLNARISDWLNIDIGGNYENQNALTNQLATENAFATRWLINSKALKDALTGKALFTNMPKGDILKKTAQKTLNYTLRGQLNFNKNFEAGLHNVSAIMGAEQKKTTNEGYTTSFFGYNGQSLIVQPINMAALNATTRPAFAINPFVSFSSNNYFGETFTDRRFMSYYGQGTYIYDSKYVATGSFRIDQSNLFGTDPQYRNKPLWSAGLNWKIDKEEFVKKLPWIDQLQLRAATGFNGNVPSSNSGSFLILSTSLNTRLNTPLIYNDVLTPENQSIRWETTKNYNLGLDFSVLKNTISGSVDWYLKKTIDAFGAFDADPSTGFSQYNANTASIQNKGLEILINSINLKRNKFEWSSQLTASFNHNKVLAIKETFFDNSSKIVSNAKPLVGLPLDAMYNYNYGGLTKLGQPYVLDRNGNQKVLDIYGLGPGRVKVEVNKEDLIYSGTTTPKYVLGLNNQLRLGAFDLSFLLMYYGGHVMRVEQPNPFINTYLQGAGNYWKMPGDELTTLVPRLLTGYDSAPGYYSSAAFNSYLYGARFVRKADYIRLRDVVITYRAKAAFLNKIGLRNPQLRFQAQNAFRYTFSGNDIDPDAINRISGVRSLENQPLYSLTFSARF